ncbi:hypothetical protein M3Y97_01002400 [Aphelenchoides bicaudatus]|nr:hypothetical protein M3Y97_01002400 [Aphelenchoides bicaudatus]
MKLLFSALLVLAVEARRRKPQSKKPNNEQNSSRPVCRDGAIPFVPCEHGSQNNDQCAPYNLSCQQIAGHGAFCCSKKSTKKEKPKKSNENEIESSPMCRDGGFAIHAPPTPIVKSLTYNVNKLDNQNIAVLMFELNLILLLAF